MAEITAQAVKQLREATGAGFMDCKRALEETAGSFDAAVALLRERGIAAAAKRAGREAREGLVSSYIHPGGRIGVLIEVNCETDFVARNEDFAKLVRDLAIQVAATYPTYVDVSDIPADVLDARTSELASDPATAGKAPDIRKRIIDGQLAKWYGEPGGVLMEQPYRDTELTVRQLVTNAIATIGENIRVRRFVRFALGEEL